jgi:hypothetical protein
VFPHPRLLARLGTEDVLLGLRWRWPAPATATTREEDRWQCTREVDGIGGAVSASPSLG